MKRLLISVTIFALLLVPQFSFGSDVDDLRATWEKGMKAYNALDAETLAAMQYYPGFVGFSPDSAFPVVGTNEADAIEGIKGFFNGLDYFQLTPYNMQYNVVGNTGIVWGNFTFYMKPEGDTMHMGYLRHTSTWIKKDGKWYILMDHNSAIPSGY